LALPSGDGLAVTIGALAFIVMFFVFAYVDLIWGPKTCLFLAVCMATCVNMPRLSQRAHETARVDNVSAGLDQL
jgi:hypothetical protein